MIGWILILILLSVAVFLVSYAIKFVLLPKEVDKLLEKIKNEPLDELIPGKINTLSLPDGHICYENNPSNNPNGETIILLHGLSQTMLSFPKYFWEPLHKAGYNIIRIDQRASGVSSWFKNWGEGNKYTLEDMADDAIKVSKQVGLEKFHLVGMSMGGMISQRVAINHPDKIKSLTSIFSTGYYYDPELKNVPPLFRLKFVLAILMYGRSLKTIDQKIKLHLSINRQLMGEGDYTYNTMGTIEKSFYENSLRNGLNGNARVQHGYAIKKSGSRLEELKSLKVPTLVIHGTTDPLVPFSHGKKCSEIIPGAKKLFLEGMGHHLPKEYCDEITQAIITHCDQNSNKNESLDIPKHLTTTNK